MADVVDKYKDKAIRFTDKGTYYELVFCDDFVIPSSGNFSEKNYTLLVDVVSDMRAANHDKEIHVFVASFGGQVHALCMLMQQLLEFKYRVGVNLGMADSCGWMLLFACQERYASPFSEFVYHDASIMQFGKVSEIRNAADYSRKWIDEIDVFTDTRNVLTEDELKLGETSEVWLTGAELIRRGAVRNYVEYKRRMIPAVCQECYQIGDAIYVKSGEGYIRYQKSPKSQPVGYEGIVKMLNK